MHIILQEYFMYQFFLFIPLHFSKGPSLMILSSFNKDKHMRKTSIYFFTK